MGAKGLFVKGRTRRTENQVFTDLTSTDLFIQACPPGGKTVTDLKRGELSYDKGAICIQPAHH